MKSALEDADAIKALKYIGIMTRKFDTSHVLLHMIVDKSYRNYHFDIASSYVGEELWKRYFQQMMENLQELMGGAPDVISRHFFEIYGHLIFSHGGDTLKCRSLEEDNAESNLTLDSLNGKVSIGRNNLPDSLTRGLYYQPMDDDLFPAVDSLSKQGMFQFTVGSEHPIRGVQFLKKLCDLYTQQNDEPKIYFVVPPFRFDSFRKQELLETNGNRKVKEIPGLKQFVLKLEV